MKVAAAITKETHLLNPFVNVTSKATKSKGNEATKKPFQKSYSSFTVDDDDDDEGKKAQFRGKIVC